MAHCQYEYTKRAAGEPNELRYEIRCAFCYRTYWIPKGDLPYDWCDVRPEQKPYAHCQHRGKQIGHRPNKLCGNCKGRGQPVFDCSVHGKCTMNPIEHSQKIKHCLGCYHDKEGFESCLSEIQTQ